MSSSDIPNDHPRADSLRMRKLIEDGVESGLVAKAGPIAHGRGEAFDYLIGETTLDCVKNDISTAAAMLIRAKDPVISVNGNTAVLAPRELVELAEAIPAKLEVNVFYGRTQDREQKIANHLIAHGAKIVYGVNPDAKVPNLHSARQHVDVNGMAIADLILVALEDGDRTRALQSWGKQVISIDLNPLSRSAQDASLNICDHVVRALKLLTENVKHLKSDPAKVDSLISQLNNKKSIAMVLKVISERMVELANELNN
jgi:4-phosphopantoate--beta-alanine ligase